MLRTFYNIFLSIISYNFRLFCNNNEFLFKINLWSFFSYNMKITCSENLCRGSIRSSNRLPLYSKRLKGTVLSTLKPKAKPILWVKWDVHSAVTALGRLSRNPLATSSNSCPSPNSRVSCTVISVRARPSPSLPYSGKVAKNINSHTQSKLYTAMASTILSIDII